MRPLVTYTENAAGLGVQISEWLYLDAWCPGPVSVQVAVYNAPGAPVRYTIQQTLDDPNDPASSVPPAFVSWWNCGDTNLVNSTVPAQTYYASAPRYVRLVQLDGTGIAQLTAVQLGSICS
jgi:hypothetical protein